MCLRGRELQNLFPQQLGAIFLAFLCLIGPHMQRGALTLSIHWTGTACPAQVLPCRLTPLNPPSNVTYTPDTQQTASIGSPPLQSNSCLKKGRRWQTPIAHKQWAHLGLSGSCTRNKPFLYRNKYSQSFKQQLLTVRLRADPDHQESTGDAAKSFTSTLGTPIITDGQAEVWPHLPAHL